MKTIRSLFTRRMSSVIRRKARPVHPLAVTHLEDRVNPAPIQFFYLPMPETATNDAFDAIVDEAVDSTQVSITTITVSESNTRIWYDHWEDGYETILGSPRQTTTRIWGDGNNANGIAPGFANDPNGLASGTVIRLRNDVNTPRNLTTQPILFDSPDRFGADRTLAVSRAQFPTVVNGGGGSVISSAVEVRDTRYYDTAFTAPVGTNTGNAGSMFTFSAFFVQAAQDNTRIQIDANNDGDFLDADDRDVTVNQGQTVVSGQNVVQGGRVVASRPVQTQLMTGEINANFASRSYSLFSNNQLANDYFTPVGFNSAVDTTSDDVRLYVYNPNATPIDVRQENDGGVVTTKTIAAGSSDFFDVTYNAGTRLFSVGGEPFAAAGTHDQQGTTHDWGFSLQPVPALSQIAIVGLGVGNSNDPPAGGGNTSPVFVTVLGNTTLQVDHDNDGTVDQTVAMTRLQTVRLRDITDSDDDNSGMRIFTTDGTLISVAWGEDGTAPTGSPGFDAGTTVPALAVPEFYKFVDFAPGGDLNGDGLYNSGDVLRYTLRIRNIGSDPIASAVLTDALPTAFVTYVSGTSTVNYGSGLTGIPDDLVGTAFPLDAGGYTVSPINAGSVIFVAFDVTINGGLPAGTTTISNAGNLAYDVYNLPAVVDLGLRGTIGDTVYRDDNGNGTQNAGEAGIFGVTVRLIRDLDGDGVIDAGEPVVDTQTTDANGNYRFIDLTDDDYIVDVTDTGNVLTGSTLTGGTDPRPVALAPGAIDNSADFGYQYTVDLSLTKTVSNATANVGTNVTFTITVSNNGSTSATGVTVRDLLPSGVQYVSDNGGGAYNSGTGIWTIGTIANGGSASLQITVTILASGSYTNYAQVMTSGNPDPDSTPGDNSTTQDDDDSVTLTPTPVADLSLTKSVDNAAPAVGTNVTFTIVLTNNGPSTATGIQVSDVLPAGLTFVSSSDASYNPAGGDNIWNIASLASGGTATLTVVARVRLASGGPITNYAQVAGVNEVDPDSTPATTPPPRMTTTAWSSPRPRSPSATPSTTT
jgi:uncharacterized repeat protein (TIGR01451 family)